MSDQKQPDWDKITEGKIRHGVAVAFIEKGQELNPDNMKTMEKWVQFIIHGYDGIKGMLDKNKAMTNGELKDAVVKKFDGEVIKETDEEYIKREIEKAVATLGQKDKNKVLYQLKNGNITLENLQACLDKIGTMKHF
tara:strand:- start:1264 stop:1674 length:411 start_codon:yes stop_codon:yes gene_type:complete